MGNATAEYIGYCSVYDGLMGNGQHANARTVLVTHLAQSSKIAAVVAEVFTPTDPRIPLFEGLASLALQMHDGQLHATAKAQVIVANQMLVEVSNS